jgi:predicted house-cleaning NTP pyrophosphatase (Maf/HAM1 superfamily)
MKQIEQQAYRTKTCRCRATHTQTRRARNHPVVSAEAVAAHGSRVLDKAVRCPGRHSRHVQTN